MAENSLSQEKDRGDSTAATPEPEVEVEVSHETMGRLRQRDGDGFYETIGHGGGAAIGHVPERTQHSLELHDHHLADPELLAKHRPWVVRGGSIKSGPYRVVSATTPGIGFSVAAGWPEIQEAFAAKLASMLNGDDDASA